LSSTVLCHIALVTFLIIWWCSLSEAKVCYMLSPFGSLSILNDCYVVAVICDFSYHIRPFCIGHQLALALTILAHHLVNLDHNRVSLMDMSWLPIFCQLPCALQL